MQADYLLKNQYDLFNIGVQALFLNQKYNTSNDIFYNYLNDIEKNSTNSKNVEIENKKHIDILRRNESYFIELLLDADFEDGISNDAISYIKKQLNINSIATSSWLADFFAKYSINEIDTEEAIPIIYGLLRIIAYINNHDCFDYIKGILILILQSTLKMNIPYLQEAGLMVIESWRSLECLKILNDLTFTDNYVSKYAKLLQKEISDELNTKNEVQSCLFE